MKVGDKIEFTIISKNYIESRPEEERDVIYYMRNEIFEVEEVKRKTVKLLKTGFGWCNMDAFNVL